MQRSFFVKKEQKTFATFVPRAQVIRGMYGNAQA